MVLKTGKNRELVESCRPICLLPVLSKVLEIIFLNRLTSIVESKKILSNHKFWFRKDHGTIEQVHRLVEKIHLSFEKKSSAAFLDISKAFDKVWHDGMMFKLKKLLPTNHYMLLRSYLSNRKFFVKHGEKVTNLFQLKAKVLQGSVLGPILYLLREGILVLSIRL